MTCKDLLFSPPLLPILRSAPGSGPMFRSTTVAVEPISQTRPTSVQSGADMHPSSTTLETSKHFCQTFEYLMSTCLFFADGDITLILRD